MTLLKNYAKKLKPDYKDVKQVDQLRANKPRSGRKIHSFKDFTRQAGLFDEGVTC